MSIRTPTLPSSPPGWADNGVATTPCYGARPKDGRHKVVHDASGEVGNGVAVINRTRTRPSANGGCRSTDLKGKELHEPSVDKDGTWCP